MVVIRYQRSMTCLRRRLAWLVSGWLACQFAGVAAAPLVFWQIPTTHSEERCDCPLEAGAACPMHHTATRTTTPTTGHDDTCKMRNAFGSAEQALFSLAGGNSVLPSLTAQVIAFDRGDRIGVAEAAVLSLFDVPDAPPPRL
jgi:hypothetical protein